MKSVCLKPIDGELTRKCLTWHWKKRRIIRASQLSVKFTMNKPILYIFDPESPDEDFLEIPLEEKDEEYVVTEYIFLAEAEGGVAISCRICKQSLNYSFSLIENGKQKVSFLGKKGSCDSNEPVIMYTSIGGDVYQISVKI